MADGVEVGRAFVSIAGEVNAAELARKGQAAASAFVKGFSGVAKAGLATVENKAVAAQHALGFVATAGTKSFSAISTAASNTQQVLTSVHSGIMKMGSLAVGAGATIPRAFGMMSEGARHLSNEIGLSSFRLQMMGGVLTGVVTAPLLAATKAIATFGLTTAMSMEDAQVALSALLPPGYDVEALILRLQALAISSPVFVIDQLENFTKRLVGAGVEIGQAEQLLDSLNKIMITFGVTGENASMVLLGVQQVFQKGKVQSEELTRQISQQLPIWNLLSQASGKTQQELLEMSIAGEFTSQMFADMLVQVGQLPSITAGAAGGVKTLSAQLSILKESFQQKIGIAFLQEFGDFKTFLEALQPAIDDFTALVVRSIPQVVDLLGSAVNGLFLLRREFEHLAPETQALLIQIAKIAPVVGPALLIIGALASSLSALLGLLAFAIHPVTVFAAVFVYAIQLLYRTSEDFRTGVEAFRAAFVQAFQAEMPGAMREFSTVVQQELVPALADLAKAFGFTTWTDFGTWLGQTLPRLLVRAVRELVTGITLITKAVEFLSSEWVKLDEQTRKNILRFAALSVVLVPLLPVLAGVAGAIATIAKVFAILTSVNSLVLFGVIALAAGIRYLWLNSELFRTSMIAFADAFKRSWVANMLPAIAAFKQAVMTDLIPALIGAGKALGFTTWVEFATFMGGALPKLMAKAVHSVTMSVGLIADAVRYLTGVWAGLSDQTKATVTKLIGLTILLLPFLPILAAIASATFGIAVAMIGLGTAIVTSVIGVVGALVGVLFRLVGVAGSAIGAMLSLRLVMTGGLVLAFVAVAYAAYKLYESSELMRESISAFTQGFLSAWQQRVPAAAQAFADAVTGNLLPAILELAHVLGFDTWQEFAFWMGTIIPRALSNLLDVATAVVNGVAGIISYFSERWGALTDTQKENIKTMLEWAAAAAGIILVAKSFVGAILKVFSPWELLTIGLVAGFKYLWDSSATFREGILAFGNAFTASWKSNVIPALTALWNVLKAQLGPALLDLAHAFGLPQFATFQDFMAWFGTVLPQLLSSGIQRLTESISVVSGWIQILTDKWNGLGESTQDTILKFLAFGALAVPFSGQIATISKAIAGLVLSNPLLAILGLALVAIGYGIKYLWDNSADFRAGIHAFGESFKRVWGEEGPAAIQRLKDALKNDLGPAFKELGAALGFDSFKEFGEWLGGKFAQGAVGAIDGLTWSVGKLADGFRWLADNMPAIKDGIAAIKDRFAELRDIAGDLKDRWDGLNDSTQHLIEGLGLAAAGAFIFHDKLAPLTGLLGNAAGGLIGATAHLAGNLTAMGTAAATEAVPALFNLFKASPIAGLAVGALAAAVGGLAFLFVGMAVTSENFREAMGRFFVGFKAGVDLFIIPAVRDLKAAFQDMAPALEELAKGLGFQNLGDMALFFGMYLSSTIATSIRFLSNGIDALTSWIDVFSRVVKAARALAENATNPIFAMSQALTALTETHTAQAEQAKRNFLAVHDSAESNLAQDVPGCLRDLKELFAETGASSGTDLRDPLASSQSSITDRFKQLFGDASAQLGQTGVMGVFTGAADEAKDMAGRIGLSLGDTSGFMGDTQQAASSLGATSGEAFDNATLKSANLARDAQKSFADLRATIDLARDSINFFGFTAAPQALGYFGDIIMAVVKGGVDWFNYLADAIKNPLNRIIDYINHGIIDPYNRVAALNPASDMIGYYVPHLARGGLVSGPGTGTSDSILARLSHGEFVMKAAAVDYWGVNAMNAMNNMRPSPVTPPGQSADTMLAQSSQTTRVDVYIDGVLQETRQMIDQNNRQIISAGYTGRRK